MAKIVSGSITVWHDGDEFLEPTCRISENYNGGVLHYCWTCNAYVTEACSEITNRLNEEKD